MKPLFVVKYDGSRQPYSQEKVINSLLRSGVAKQDVLKILVQVESRLYDGIKTSQLYEIVNNVLDRSPKITSHFYRLRESLARMDSINFEKFVKELLEKEGYKCQWNVIVRGFCIEHQVDIIAQKGSELFFVEVKHHTNFHRDCGLGTVIELWGRLDDLQDGFEKNLQSYKFSTAWLFCNTKFSEHATKYAKAKNLLLTGWRYSSSGLGLEKMVERMGEAVVGRLIATTPLLRQPADSRDFAGQAEETDAI